MKKFTPNDPFPRSTPEDLGIDSQGLLACLDALEAGKLHPHSFMLLRRGAVAAEGWWSPYDPGCRGYLYSLSKSFTSTAVGFAVQEGRMSVDDRVISFFPEDLPATVSDNLAAMRVKDLLTMTSGHAVDTTMVLNPGVENWAQAILALPVPLPPGTHFLYNSGASYLLSALLHKLNKRSVLDYLTPRLFAPLGIRGMTWDSDPRGINTGGWGLSLRTTDLARFGMFLLQRGVWNGKQLLAQAWIEEATGKRVPNDGQGREKEPTDWRQGYGYQFWRCQHGAYRADGAYGQYCIVLPEQEAVLVITSETAVMQGFLDAVWKHILPAMHPEPLAPQRAPREKLLRRLAELEMAVPPAQPLPEAAARISGRRFIMDTNQAGIREVSFTFEEQACVFRLRDESGESQAVCGYGSWKRSGGRMPFLRTHLIEVINNLSPQGAVRFAAHGEWTDPDTYVMTWQFLETPHSNTITCLFQGDELQMEVTTSILEASNPLLAGRENTYRGRLEV